MPDIKIIESKSLGGSEDVAFMIERVQNKGGQATYIIIGSNLSTPHHSERFDFDEKALLTAMLVYMKLLLRINGRYW